ncbi:hypothetical protein ACTNDY_06435 [Tissierellaceae bacterium HCP3S3_D8]
MKKMSMYIMIAFIILSTSFSAFAGEVNAKNLSKPTGIPSKSEYHAEGLHNEEIMRAKGSIIDSTNLELYLSGNRNLVIEAWTSCIEKASLVGFKEISLQRWDGDRWVNVLTPWDDLEKNIQKHDLFYKTKVEGGYYYKASLYHYAQQGTGAFANKQENFNETKYIWVG